MLVQLIETLVLLLPAKDTKDCKQSHQKLAEKTANSLLICLRDATLLAP